MDHDVISLIGTGRRLAAVQALDHFHPCWRWLQTEPPLIASCSN